MCVWVAVQVKTLKPIQMFKLHLLTQHLHNIHIHILYIKTFSTNTLHTLQDIRLWKVQIHIHYTKVNNRLNKLGSHTGWILTVGTIELFHTYYTDMSTLTQVNIWMKNVTSGCFDGLSISIVSVMNQTKQTLTLL